MSNLHAHVERYQSDCDGGHSRDYVMTMNDEELADDLGDVTFTARVAMSISDFYASADDATLRVEVGSDYRRFVFEAPTDEGSIHNEATLCTDECNTDRRGQVEQYAEMMGY